jgi:membrane-bound metal-dependent hydrolase YbcI (DUF457 family)
MFIGHFAVGFASKRVAPRTSLGLLLAAPLLADIIWPVLLLAGVEKVRITGGTNPFLTLTFDSYPWSHSLLMLTIWGVLLAGGYYAVTKYRPGATILFVGVLSHWVLDVVTHVQDMPLAPGVPTFVGLGLWHSVVGTVVIEGVMFVAGVWLYSRVTTPRDKIGRWAWWAYVVLLVASYLSQFGGGTPPSVQAIGWLAIIMSVVMVAWAWWLDRHRDLRASAN